VHPQWVLHLLTVLVLLTAAATPGCGTKRNPVRILDVPATALTWCADVDPIMRRLCTSCHASTRPSPPRGVVLDTYAGVSAAASRASQLMQSGAMPPGGGATAADDAVLVGWIRQGKPECGGPADGTGPPDDPEDQGAADAGDAATGDAATGDAATGDATR